MKTPDIPLTLSFDDLLPDANGEIVVVGGGDRLQLAIVTDQRVCESGIAHDHVTIDGIDVSGLPYVLFEGGMRLYVSPEIDLTIAPLQG